MTSRVGLLPGASGVVQIEYDSLISAVDELISPPPEDKILAPGFVDLQVNGFAGVDYNEPATPGEAIRESVRKIFETGVTRFFPTIITGPEKRIVEALRNLARMKREFEAAGLPEAEAIAGFHVEGPHISPEDGPRGAHPMEHVRPPDTAEFERWQEAADGFVRLVTVSPEWPGTPDYIRYVTGRGVAVSIGHTKASAAQIGAAADAGATLSTHLGNGAHAVLPKTDNYLWSQLVEDRLTAAFILDGIHIREQFFRAALRCKGVEHSFLVTDAVMPAMCEPGFYRLGEVEVELKQEGQVVLRGGSRLAGSALRMDRAIGNAVRLGRLSLREALVMATTTAARAGRIAGRQRGLVPGEKADLVRFAWDQGAQRLTVVETVVAGHSVFSQRDG